MTWEALAELVNSPGALALLVLAAMWAGSKGGWVFGWVHRNAVERERERAQEWRDIALGTLPVAEKAVGLIERRAESRGPA